MKKFIVIFTALLSIFSNAQTKAIIYSTSTATIANPERGFYKHTETHSTGYSNLSQSTLTSYRTNSNISLILRVFYLENFVNSSISSAYLTSMQADFVKIRAAGLKCIVRFAYADHNDPGVPHDATKARILAHITQLQPILQANSDVISVMQAGFIGSWGEWYYTDNFGMTPTATDYINRKAVVDALLLAVPNRMAQIRTPSLKMNIFNSTTPLSLTQAYTATNIARVGHHNDCFLASSSDYGTYKNIATEYPYLEQETKYLPMGGETCAVNAPRSQCATAMLEMAKFHWSYMNIDYNENVISAFQSDNCFTSMQNRLGYRFELVSGSFANTAAIGTAMPVTIKIKNTGFATPFNARTAYVVFRNSVTNAEYRVALNSKPRVWNAATTTTISQNITVPNNMVAGSYKLYLAIPDADAALAIRPEYAIRMANGGTVWDAAKGYNNLLHTLTVTSPMSRAGDITQNQSTLKGAVYPVPADNMMAIEMENIADYSISLFNSLGQKVVTDVNIESDNKITMNTEYLKDGVYTLNLVLGATTETKRIIISH